MVSDDMVIDGGVERGGGRLFLAVYISKTRKSNENKIYNEKKVEKNDSPLVKSAMGLYHTGSPHYGRTSTADFCHSSGL